MHSLVTEWVLDLMEDGIDVAFRVGDLHTDNLIARPIMQMRTKLVAAPALLEQWGTPASPADLTNFSCAGWHAPTSKVCDGNLPKALVCLACSAPMTPMHSPTPPNKATCFASCPITLLIRADTLIREHGMVEVLPEWPMQQYPISMLYPAHRQASAVIKAFLAVCAEGNSGLV